MKGKIKILSLLLALTMVSSMFVACKGEEKPTGDSSKPTGEKPAEVTEISWYAWGDKPNQAATVEAALNEKSVKDIGIKVNFKWQTSNDESLRTTLASGDKDVDIAFACGWFADYVGSAQKNYFMDLTDMLPTVAPDLYKKLPKTLWDGVKVDGKIYGIPTWKDSAAVQYWLGRKDILEAANATEVFSQAGLKTATLTPTLEKIKAWHDADPAKNLYSEGNTAPINFNKAGLNGHNTGWDELQADLRIGVKIAAGNTKVQSYYTDPDYIAEFKTLKDWADRGLSNGKVALQVEQEPQLITVSTAQGWDGAQFTAWGGPVKGYDTLIQKKAGPFLTSGYVQGGVNVVGAGSKKAEAALKYLQYVNTNAEYRNMLTYGIKDTNWKEVDGTAEVLTGQDWAPGNFGLGSYDLLLPGKGCPPTMYTDLCETVNTAEASELLGFVPSIDKIANEIAACVSLIQEVMQPLQCGAVKDVEAEVASLLKKLDAQGYQKFIDEYKSQVDAFLAAKK
ncbi:MAG: DUF3502 domain-containing protein [Oscillospiraceae bacterium]